MFRSTISASRISIIPPTRSNQLKKLFSTSQIHKYRQWPSTNALKVEKKPFPRTRTQISDVHHSGAPESKPCPRVSVEIWECVRDICIGTIQLSLNLKASVTHLLMLCIGLRDICIGVIKICIGLIKICIGLINTCRTICVGLTNICIGLIWMYAMFISCAWYILTIIRGLIPVQKEDSISTSEESEAESEDKGS